MPTFTHRLPRGIPANILFYAAANGSPAMWNKAGSTETWSKRMLKTYRSPSVPTPMTALARLDAMWQFLRMRVDAQGQALTALLGEPAAQEDGWFRSQWLALKKEEDCFLALMVRSGL